ncbi:WecB/TagA/CpsF family glycosyltransferase [Spongiibacter marinus]|uniref:WecB/TagA/CpsF family glycosyltransferase n=1 Tax=Spongiibacter marinus TaxID=354246 RepID=UPI000405471F|nr:WecB/TagA/CpsF family glycosyltransferase [Spongiibacter marinus]
MKKQTIIAITERFIAALSLVFISPLLAAHAVKQRIAKKPFIKRETIYRANGGTTDVITLSERNTWSRAPMLWNVVTGDIDLVGTRPRSAASRAGTDAPFYQPGLFSLYELRRISGLDFIDEQQCNAEFAENCSLGQRLAIFFRSLAAATMYRNETPLRDCDAFNVFGVRIDNFSMDKTLATIARDIFNDAGTSYFFANAHTLNQAYNDATYRRTLNNADYLLPDGSGIEIACRRSGIHRKGNINGTDLLPLLCEQMARKNQRLFMLGGEPGIADKAMKNIQKRVPQLISAGCHHGFFDKDDCDALIAEINNSGADVLLVGLGQPIQEQWLAAHRDKITIPVAMAVGGLFDFYAEKVSRAPLWLRELGMEWVWRLKEEPSRMWKRYVIGNPLFLLRLQRNTGSVA